MTYVPSPNLDDLFLDIATSIELSNRDRQVAESRYRQLKSHLERPGSPIALFLTEDEGHIYPQGSIAAGTAVVYGSADDRFDLDALVELKVPPQWSPKTGLDLLYQALKDFPGAVEVVRCTRCVQIQFAFMHMDVTIMDPVKGQRVERVGDIFHSADNGEQKTVPANPYGFSQWIRVNALPSSDNFKEILNARRQTNGIDRLYRADMGTYAEDTKQDDLPPVLPPRMDSEQIVALKLMKRYLNLRYEERDVRRVPSIYVSKLAIDVGGSPYGLTSQLLSLATYVKQEMDRNIAAKTFPDERNPTYREDKLNDRWPESIEDMRILSADMTHLINEVERSKELDFKGIKKVMEGLFGETITTRSVSTFLERDNSPDAGNGRTFVKGAGTVLAAATFAAPAIAKALAPVPNHHFHCGEE
jgi:hypothetical protein